MEQLVKNLLNILQKSLINPLVIKAFLFNNIMNELYNYV